VESYNIHCKACAGGLDTDNSDRHRRVVRRVGCDEYACVTRFYRRVQIAVESMNLAAKLTQGLAPLTDHQNDSPL
jgi:hypothetical protein